MKIGWVGFHKEGMPALRGVLEQGYDVRVIVTLIPDKAAKRSAAVDYRGIAKEFGVLLHETESINAPDTVRLLRSLCLDLVFVIGWSQIVYPKALHLPRLGMIGAHASLLPHNRGSAPVNWALIRGESQGGNSLIWLAEGVDEGRIIDQMSFSLTAYDTCDTVYDKIAETNRQMILNALPRLVAGEHLGYPQPSTKEPLLPRRRPKDGLIDWNQSASNVYNFVRALTRPYPGAFTRIDGHRWLVWKCALLPLSANIGRPGEVIGPIVSTDDASCGQMVACRHGAIAMLEVESSAGEVLTGRELSEKAWTGKVLGNEQTDSSNSRTS